MSIYIKETHTVYTDQSFPETLERSKIWRDRETNNLTIKNLDNFGKELGYEFITEIKPNVYYIDGDIIDITNNKPITTSTQLSTYYKKKLLEKMSTVDPNYTIPKHITDKLKGLELIKSLKRNIEEEYRRFKRDEATTLLHERQEKYVDKSLLRAIPKTQSNYPVFSNKKVSIKQLLGLIQALDRSENHGSKHTHKLTAHTQLSLLAYFGCPQNYLLIYQDICGRYYTKKYKNNISNSKDNPFKKGHDTLTKDEINHLLTFVIGDRKFDNTNRDHLKIPSEMSTVSKTISTFLHVIGYDRDWIDRTFVPYLDNMLIKHHKKSDKDIKNDRQQNDGRYNFSY